MFAGIQHLRTFHTSLSITRLEKHQITRTEGAQHGQGDKPNSIYIQDCRIELNYDQHKKDSRRLGQLDIEDSESLNAGIEKVNDQHNTHLQTNILINLFVIQQYFLFMVFVGRTLKGRDRLRLEALHEVKNHA